MSRYDPADDEDRSPFEVLDGQGAPRMMCWFRRDAESKTAEFERFGYKVGVWPARDSKYVAEETP